MNKLESSYTKFMGYRIACNSCDELYLKDKDDPFICFACSEG